MNLLTKLPTKKAKIIQLVDELGDIKAAISKLEEREREITEELKLHGPGLYKGSLFECNLFEQQRSTIDWRGLADHLKVADRVIERYTTIKTLLVCKLQPRSAR